MKPPRAAVILIAALPLMMIGCDENRRMAELAQRELEHRATETQQLARLHSKVQEERLELGKGRDMLEEDRRQLATQRHRDPLIATAITSAVGILVCVLPLLICWRLLQTPDQHEVEQAMGEVFIADFVAEELLLLPRASTPLPFEPNSESID